MEKPAAHKSRLGVAVRVPFVLSAVYMQIIYVEKKLYIIVNINNKISSRDNMELVRMV